MGNPEEHQKAMFFAGQACTLEIVFTTETQRHREERIRFLPRRTRRSRSFNCYFFSVPSVSSVVTTFFFSVPLCLCGNSYYPPRFRSFISSRTRRRRRSRDPR